VDATFRAFITSWDWRPEIIVILLGLAGAYLAGWLRLRRRGARLAGGWRLVSYLAGLTILAVALMSAVDVLSSHLFFMHMIQHLLMVAIAPVLIYWGQPFPITFWSLPRRGALGQALFSRRAALRQLVHRLSAPGLLGMTYVVFLWGWHDPQAYSAALRYPWLHDVEHLTFFLPAMAVWWRVMNAAPRFGGRFSAGGRVALILSVAAAKMAVGVVIALAPDPIYPYYAAMPRLWGISVMTDQRLSGIIMWIPGTMMHMLSALAIAAGAFSRADNGPSADRSRYLREANMSLP
jgi:cytochrome c oxidase assembly factor CtaG